MTICRSAFDETRAPPSNPPSFRKLSLIPPAATHGAFQPMLGVSLEGSGLLACLSRKSARGATASCKKKRVLGLEVVARGSRSRVRLRVDLGGSSVFVLRPTDECAPD